MAVLRQEAARSRRDGSPLCVVIADLDDFKEINDRGGHSAGDLHLKEVAAAWSSAIRTVDGLARWVATSSRWCYDPQLRGAGG